jgi:hypothetical protein
MSIFELYLTLGFEHIADFAGYDHILFLISLSAVYLLSDWKHVLILITAFTLGHSITLALATLKIIPIKPDLIEFLIPLTIILSAVANFYYKGNTFSVKLHRLKYAMALFFGLIHGMGFSNYLQSLLGREASIVKPLFAFNIGLELGQIAIVLTVLIISTLLHKFIKSPKRELNLVLSGASLGVALILSLERWPF